MIADTYTINGINFVSISKDFYNKKFYISPSDEENDLNKIIKKIADFNINKTNNKNETDFIIEFYFGTQAENKVNFVYNKTVFPLISSMTILDDCTNVYETSGNMDDYNLIAFTNISFKTYKYKKYRKQENGKKIVISTTKKNRHFVYSGENANIFINKNNVSPVVLFINIWDKQFVKENNTQTKCCDINLEIDNISFVDKPNQHIELNNNLTTEFYENFLYKKDNDCLKFLLMILQEHQYKNIEFTDIYDIKLEELKKLKNKYGDVINDVRDINKSYMKQNRFYQRFITKTFSSEICNWLIKDAEEYVSKNGWDKDNFKNYQTYDLKLSNLTNFQEYFLNHELSKIMKYIEKSYCLPDETRFDISDLNVIKYSEELQTHLENHMDSSFITFNIALSDNTEYEGGGTYFDDGIIVNIDKGEMLVHCGKVIHSGLSITKGVRYILVGFINIVYEA